MTDQAMRPADPHSRDIEWLVRSTAATVTRADVAEILGVDERTVTRAIGCGQLPCVRVGRRVLVPRLPLLARLIDPQEDGGDPA